jgi:hypothetical protein
MPWFALRAMSDADVRALCVQAALWKPGRLVEVMVTAHV